MKQTQFFVPLLYSTSEGVKICVVYLSIKKKNISALSPTLLFPLFSGLHFCLFSPKVCIGSSVYETPMEMRCTGYQNQPQQRKEKDDTSGFLY